MAAGQCEGIDGFDQGINSESGRNSWIGNKIWIRKELMGLDRGEILGFEKELMALMPRAIGDCWLLEMIPEIIGLLGVAGLRFRL